MQPLVYTTARSKKPTFNWPSVQSILALGILACVTQPVSAMLSVVGNEITWSEDGWYQVQRMDTFESVCESGSFCVVDDGTYIVINHTTGQRFENIIVSGDSLLDDVSVVSDQPAPPANLRVTVYSDTAAEIFWDRVVGQQLSYEVRVGGVVVQTTLGTSSFLADLTRGSSALVDVVAIDSDGRRSNATNIAVTTDGSFVEASGDDAPTDDSISAPVTSLVSSEDSLPEIQPQDLSIEVYSASSAELFWTPNGRFRPRISANEIRRDGVLIDTVEGEFLRSYLDSNREPGVVYTYEVTAVSPAGRGSATITGPGFNPMASAVPDPIDSDISAATMQRLETILSIVNGEAVEKGVATFLRLATSILREDSGFVEIDSGTDPGFGSGTFRRFSCPDGGQVRVFPFGTGFSNDATECKVGPITMTGETRGRVAIFEPGVVLEVSSFVAEDGLIEDERDGSFIEFAQISFSQDDDNPLISNYSLVSTIVNQAGIRWAAEVGLNVNGEDTGNVLPDGSLGTSVRVFTSLADSTLSVTGIFDEAVDLRTLGPIEFASGRELGQPTAGRLFAGTEDNSVLIDFFNGDPNSFTLTETENGATTSYTIPFGERYRIENANPLDADIGF